MAGCRSCLATERLVRVAAVAEDVAAAARSEGTDKREQSVRLGKGFATEDAHAIPLLGWVEKSGGEPVHRHEAATVRVPAVSA